MRNRPTHSLEATLILAFGVSFALVVAVYAGLTVYSAFVHAADRIAAISQPH